MGTTFNEATSNIAEALVEHKSEIGVGFGMVAGVLALGFAVIGSMRMQKEFDAKKPKTKKEKALIAAKHLAPAVAAEVASVVLIKHGFDTVLAERNEAKDTAAAAIASAALAHEALKVKDEAIKDVVDDKKRKEIDSLIAQKTLDNHPIDGKEVAMAAHPQQLFYDQISDRYFMSSMNDVENAIKMCNNNIMVKKRCLGANEYYWNLGLKELPKDEKLGWLLDTDGFLDPVYEPGFATDGRTCVVISGLDAPEASYWEYARKYPYM